MKIPAGISLPADRTILECIGRTPLIRLRAMEEMGCLIFAKCEFFNPTGSLKDRMVCYMIRAAETRGELRPGSRIVEATSGNTGISLAMIGRRLGYRVTAVMPETMSVERRRMMAMYGAEFVLTPGKDWMAGSLQRAEEIGRLEAGAWLLRQFSNPDNVACHESTTGPEIAQAAGRVDAFVAGVGTGGTVMGVGRFLKSLSPTTRIIAVEPEESAVLSGGGVGRHTIQGIGPGFVPDLFDRSLVDEVARVGSAAAMAMKERLAAEEGLFVGISSGATVLAAQKIARTMKKGSRIVAMLADSGDRYLSMGKTGQAG
jgi:cysteine synthase A